MKFETEKEKFAYEIGGRTCAFLLLIYVGPILIMLALLLNLPPITRLIATVILGVTAIIITHYTMSKVEPYVAKFMMKELQKTAKKRKEEKRMKVLNIMWKDLKNIIKFLKKNSKEVLAWIIWVISALSGGIFIIVITTPKLGGFGLSFLWLSFTTWVYVSWRRIRKK